MRSSISRMLVPVAFSKPAMSPLSRSPSSRTSSAPTVFRFRCAVINILLMIELTF